MRSQMLKIGLGVALLAISIVLWEVKEKWWLPLVLTPLILLAFEYSPKLSAYWKTCCTILLSIIVLVFVGYLINTIRINVENPPRWDFHLFWTFGRASAAGLDPYDHQNLLTIISPLDPPPILIEELYFFHEPPTLFLFAPLGWFSDIKAAALFWYLVNALFLVLVIVMLWRQFSDQRSYLDLLFVSSLVLTFYPTLENVSFAQLNYLLLFLILLFWNQWNKPIGALWLVLGIFTKPIMLFFLLFLVLMRAWRQIIYTVAVTAVVSLITVLVYGPKLFVDYLSNNPIINKMPLTLYYEIGNQSLLATILRLTHSNPTNTSPLLNPIFVVVAGIITLISIVFIVRLGEKHAHVGLALVLSLGLLIFPKTLNHYAFLLLPAILLIWKQRNLLPRQHITAIVFITVVYFVVAYQGGDYTFIAYALSWLALVGFSIRILQNTTDEKKTKESLNYATL